MAHCEKKHCKVCIDAAAAKDFVPMWLFHNCVLQFFGPFLQTQSESLPKVNCHTINTHLKGKETSVNISFVCKALIFLGLKYIYIYIYIINQIT